MHDPTDRITHTTAFVTPVVEHWLERETSQWVHPTKDRFDDPSHHERTFFTTELHLAPFTAMNTKFQLDGNVYCFIPLKVDPLYLKTSHRAHALI